MRIVYYRNQSGVIYNFHTVDDRVSEKELLTSIFDVNKKHDMFTAYVEQFQDDSFTAYLFRSLREARSYPRECIANALQALETATDEIREIERYAIYAPEREGSA